MDKKKQLQNFVRVRPYLVWHVKDYNSLSTRSIAESVFNYGNWEDYLLLESIFGTEELSSLFKQIKNQKRTNLRPQTINYFSNYFDRYA